MSGRLANKSYPRPYNGILGFHRAYRVRNNRPDMLLERLGGDRRMIEHYPAVHTLHYCQKLSAAR
jgi:hypothetical protein